MTSSNGNISALLAICAGNSPVSDEFPAQRPVTRSFYAFFDLRPYKRLSKQLWCWWFETHSPPIMTSSNALAIPHVSTLLAMGEEYFILGAYIKYFFVAGTKFSQQFHVDFTL